MNDPRESTRDRGSSRAVPAASPRSDRALERIGEALSGLRYGSVLAIVQDGVVIQIDRTEKTRFDKQSPPPKRDD
jgi:hypothetical protein